MRARRASVSSNSYLYNSDCSFALDNSTLHKIEFTPLIHWFGESLIHQFGESLDLNRYNFTNYLVEL